MSEQPLVTIGLSTYNRANGYLREALESALAQTYPNLEIVVSDNCSSDNTPQVVRSLADDRVRFYRQQENIGPNNNFNFVLQQARGEYFLLLHDDDKIDPDFVASCMEAAAGRDIALIRSGTRVIDADGNVLASDPNHCGGMPAADLFFTWFGRGTAFYLASTLYRTELLRKHGGFNSPKNLFQDVVALAELACRYERVDVVDVKASFRRHDDNKGSSDSALDWATDSLFLLSRLEALLPEHAEELRRRGLPYLCRKCYRNASAISEPVERWKTYLQLFEKFEKSYSPVQFVLQRSLNRAKDTARTALKPAARAKQKQPA